MQFCNLNSNKYPSLKIVLELNTGINCISHRDNATLFNNEVK